MPKKKPSKAEIAKKAKEELRELIILTVYLYVTFAALLLFKSAVLSDEGVGWVPGGVALIKAVLIAKFVLIGQAAHIGERFRTRPLIWPTLYQSAIILVFVVILSLLEEVIVGLFQGRGFWQSVAETGGDWPEKLASILLVFLIFCPYFAIRSLSGVIGRETLIRLFFVERRESAGH